MKTKYFLIFFCITTILLISTTAAADNTTQNTDKPAIHSMTMDKDITCENIQENNKTYTSNYKKTIKNKSSKKTIQINTTTLNQKLVDDQTDNTTINLKKGNYNIQPITINKNITIIGENKTQTIITTNLEDNLFKITKNNHLTLINLTIQNHLSNETPTINNAGELTINNAIIKNNTCHQRSSKGGAIYNTGNLTVNNTEFSQDIASWGASIYNQGGNTKINNTIFMADQTYNVGGAIYSIRGNLSIDNTKIVQNTAVSGAGIYNAFGNLFVNNTLFLKNHAQSFYGGAIYSTGIANIENTNFLFNKAQYMGGAITNTNNFTARNCSFESNTAGESGGAIENIAWTKTENGNLTLIKCNFTENIASTANGGAIINLNTTPEPGNYGTITAKECIFDSNTASKKGGAIYNDQYINTQYNIFRNNEAETNNEIYTHTNMIKSIENNWWGENNPNWNKVGVTPEKWVVMTFTNTTILLENMQTKTLITLNTLNDNTTLKEELPTVEAIYSSKNATYKQNYQKLTTTTQNICTPTCENITATIDNQKIVLTPIKSNITYKLSKDNNQIHIIYNLPDIINAKTSVKINGITILNKKQIQKGKLNLIYTIPALYNKDNYTMTYVINNNGNILNKNVTLNLLKRNITMNITLNQTKIQVGDTIKIQANLILGSDPITTGRVSFKINGRTIKSNIQVINGRATITYKIPDSFRASKNYIISVVYSGDNNKNKYCVNSSLKIMKQDIHIDDMQPLELMADSSIRLPILLLDKYNNSIQPSKLCYKINGKTYKTNITTEDGVFYFDYITPYVKNNKSLKQTLTIKVGENKLYDKAIFNITLIIA